jgi:hypothetical protein
MGTVPRLYLRPVVDPKGGLLTSSSNERYCAEKSSLPAIPSQGIEAPCQPPGDTMTKFRTILGLAILLFAVPTFATTRYIAQTAGTFNGGSACNGQTTITPAAWNSTSLNPGDTTYVCGTLTAGTASGSLLRFSQSGSAGSPITLIFDSGAVITAPSWSAGAIELNGQNFITIDGGTNGIIQATSNGTNLGNQTDGGGCVHSGSNVSNVTIQNLTCSNIYVRASTTDTSTANNFCFQFWTGSNDTVANNTCNNMRWAILVIYGGNASSSTNIQVFNNTVSNMDHGVVFGNQGPNSNLVGSNCSNAAHDNLFSAMNTWDDTTGGNHYHHDAIHTWTTQAGGYYVCLYNNKFTGNSGAEVSGIFTMEAGATVGSAMFNNIVDMTSPGSCGDGAFAIFNGDPGTASNGRGHLILNNTVLPGSGCTIDFGIAEASGVTLENNLGLTNGNYVYQNSPITAITTADYNSWQMPAGGNPFWCSAGGGVSFSTWKSSCGFDAHGQNVAITVNSDLTLPSGSAAIGTAANLTSLGITALDKGAPQTFGAGGSCGTGCVPRPSSGPWDAGAYASGSTTAGNGPNAPSGLTAVVN